VHRCLEFDRTARPGSASELLAELEKCRGSTAQLRRSILRHPRRAALGMAVFGFLLLLAGVMFLTRAPFAERKIEAGRKQTAAKDYAAAAASFREALDVEPQNTAALNGLGRAYALAKDWAGAKASWSKSYEIQQDPKIAACLGYLESQAGNYKSAIQWYELAESMLPNSAEFANNLAHTYRLLGTATQALAFEQFDAAIALQPKLRQALSGRAKLAFTADINDHRPLRRSALVDIDQAIALPDPSPELLVLGSICHLAGAEPEDYQIAKQLSLRALEEGMSFEEFENLQRDQSLLVDPEIAKYRSKRSTAARISQESPWIDLWPGLFLLP
jgi:tetratricopeptide (TPR) repeat protein